MQSHIGVKSCDITLSCQSCQHAFLAFFNKYTCALSIKGSPSAICMNNSGVKVSYTPQLKGSSAAKNIYFHGMGLHIVFGALPCLTPSTVIYCYNSHYVMKFTYKND